MNLLNLQYSLKHKALDIFLAGCHPPHCPGCHNPISWDFNNGSPINYEEVQRYVEDNKLIDRVRLMGGEPFHQLSKELIKLLTPITKEVWVFTRYYVGELTEDQLEVLKHIDYIKCGPYVKGTSSYESNGITLASDNQYILKIQEEDTDETK